ncbi:MAG: hypothetical protein ACU84Q_13180 [Gammaproteobacteria bacterium]
MNKTDWGLPLLMLGCGVLGYILATATGQQRLAEQLARQKIDAEITKAKSHMTTILQLNDCYINEAFYSLDREIFVAKQHIDEVAQTLNNDSNSTGSAEVIREYYARFGLSSPCEDCVPRSPMPRIQCTTI